MKVLSSLAVVLGMVSVPAVSAAYLFGFTPPQIAWAIVALAATVVGWVMGVLWIIAIWSDEHDQQP